MDTNKFAARLHENPKKVRKFLREVTPPEAQPGRGHRWELPEKGPELTKLRRRYKRWSAQHSRPVAH